jgi:Mg2+ and Co2+ transporter CorA
MEHEMTNKIFKIDKDDVAEIQLDVFLKEKESSSSLYIYDLLVDDRTLALDELRPFCFPEEIYEGMQNPAENIRFEYSGNTLYGELAQFSLQTNKPHFASILIQGNVLFIVHEVEEDILPGVLKSLPSLNENQKENLTCEFLMYLIVLEFLSRKGKRILYLREEIEKLALDLDKKQSEITPEDFLDAKSQVSNFSRVLEKLIFTLSFPPAKDVIDVNSPYHLYFIDLSKTIGLLNTSLSQTEERLNSLHDHFELLLQEKSNKRLNFLTIIQAIFVPMTLLAGIYGMNFKFMPELELRYGYFLSLGAMVLIALVILRIFYKRGWFD